MLITLLVTYINFFFLKLNFIITYLICFNKMKINIILLCYIYFLVFFKKFNKAYFVVILYYILIINFNSIFFIKLFFYGFFKSHLLIFYCSVVLIKCILYNQNLYIKLSKAYLLYLISLAFILGGR
jgi:hypothetical protein